jgi:hypothetical protein
VASVAVLIPVLARPHRAEPVARSVTESDRRAVPMFLCSPGDAAELEACRAVAWTVEVGWPVGRGDYARKMNHGYHLAREHGFDWAFLGADDLVFHPGWLDACIREHERADACVVGTNDMGNARVISGRHSTHTLVHRDYLDCGTIDDDDLILHEGYWHNYVDDEFVQTAMARDTYAHAADAYVEHLHPNWKKAQDDATYRRGMEHFDDDRRLYEQRQRLWRALSVRAGR